MRFKVIDGRWCFGDAVGDAVAIDLFFNIRRAEALPSKRSRIGKEHNYKFKFANR